MSTGKTDNFWGIFYSFVTWGFWERLVTEGFLERPVFQICQVRPVGIEPTLSQIKSLGFCH